MVDGYGLENRRAHKAPWVRIPPSPLNFLNPQSLSGQRSFSTLNLRLVTTADAGCGGDKYGRLIAKDSPLIRGQIWVRVPSVVQSQASQRLVTHEHFVSSVKTLPPLSTVRQE